jgi:hypothetical protein
MDLQVYYQKVRETEALIADECTVIVSQKTGDGGKEGTLTEVPRRLAARMVVDNQARLATPVELAAYRAALAETKRQAEQVAAATRLQISVLSTRELEQLKADARKQTKG